MVLEICGARADVSFKLVPAAGIGAFLRSSKANITAATAGSIVRTSRADKPSFMAVLLYIEALMLLNQLSNLMREERSHVVLVTFSAESQGTFFSCQI